MPNVLSGEHAAREDGIDELLGVSGGWQAMMLVAKKLDAVLGIRGQAARARKWATCAGRGRAELVGSPDMASGSTIPSLASEFSRLESH
jgi:hypothetical protein